MLSALRYHAVTSTTDARVQKQERERTRRWPGRVVFRELHDQFVCAALPRRLHTISTHTRRLSVPKCDRQRAFRAPCVGEEKVTTFENLSSTAAVPATALRATSKRQPRAGCCTRRQLYDKWSRCRQRERTPFLPGMPQIQRMRFAEPSSALSGRAEKPGGCSFRHADRSAVNRPRANDVYTRKQRVRN